MKRHKRKQKQWSKKMPMQTQSCVTASTYAIPSFPELSLLDRMMEEREIVAIIKGDPE